MAGAERVEGLPVRQRRAHRQRRPDHARAEPAHPGCRPAARPVADRRARADRRGVQRAARPPAPPVRRRARLHRVLGLAPGRDQEGDGRAGAVGLRGVGRAVPADRPDGRRPQLRGDHPGQLAVGEGRRRVPDGRPSTISSCRAGCRSTSPRRCRRSPTRAADELDRRRAARRRSREHYLGARHAVRARLVHALERGGRRPDRRADARRRRGDGGRGRRQRADRRARRRVRGALRDRDRRSATTTSTRWPRGADATAAAYVEADVDDEAFWGVGIHSRSSPRRCARSSTRSTGRSRAGARGRRLPSVRLSVPVSGRSERPSLYCAAHADVAQLARASACHAEGRGFESLHPLHRKPRKRGFLLAERGRRELVCNRDCNRARPEVSPLGKPRRSRRLALTDADRPGGSE